MDAAECDLRSYFRRAVSVEQQMQAICAAAACTSAPAFFFLVCSTARWAIVQPPIYFVWPQPQAVESARSQWQPGKKNNYRTILRSNRLLETGVIRR